MAADRGAPNRSSTFVDLDRLEAVLIQAAREHRPVTYAQLLAFFGLRITPGRVRRICRDLAAIDGRVQAAGGPDLAVLVVRKADGLPGLGWFAHRAQQGYVGAWAGPEAVAYVAAAQALAFAWAGKLKPGGGASVAPRRRRSPCPPP